MRLARRQVALSLIVSILKNLNGSCTCQGQGLSDIDAIRKKGRATKIHDHNNVWWTLRSDKAQAHGNEQRKVTIDVICGRESCLCVCFVLLCLPLPVNTKHSNRKALQDTSLFPKHSFIPHIPTQLCQSNTNTWTLSPFTLYITRTIFKMSDSARKDLSTSKLHRSLNAKIWDDC